jgi:hypothetical protein
MREMVGITLMVADYIADLIFEIFGKVVVTAIDGALKTLGRVE